MMKQTIIIITFVAFIFFVEEASANGEFQCHDSERITRVEQDLESTLSDCNHDRSVSCYKEGIQYALDGLRYHDNGGGHDSYPPMETCEYKSYTIPFDLRSSCDSIGLYAKTKTIYQDNRAVYVCVCKSYLQKLERYDADSRLLCQPNFEKGGKFAHANGGVTHTACVKKDLLQQKNTYWVAHDEPCAEGFKKGLRSKFSARDPHGKHSFWHDRCWNLDFLYSSSVSEYKADGRQGCAPGFRVTKKFLGGYKGYFPSVVCSKVR